MKPFVAFAAFTALAAVFTFVTPNTAAARPRSAQTATIATTAQQTKPRCQAIAKTTKQQCKRNASAGSDYCWQHKPKETVTTTATTAPAK